MPKFLRKEREAAYRDAQLRHGGTPGWKPGPTPVEMWKTEWDEKLRQTQPEPLSEREQEQADAHWGAVESDPAFRAMREERRRRRSAM